jgi:hypothetical protein
VKVKDEDAIVHYLEAEKYQEWARTALPIAIDLGSPATKKISLSS